MKTIEIRVSHMRIFGHTVRQVREPRQAEPATDDLLPISKKPTRDTVMYYFVKGSVTSRSNFNFKTS